MAQGPACWWPRAGAVPGPVFAGAGVRSAVCAVGAHLQALLPLPRKTFVSPLWPGSSHVPPGPPHEGPLSFGRSLVGRRASKPGLGQERLLIVSESLGFVVFQENSLSKQDASRTEVVSKKELHSCFPLVIFMSRKREVCLQPGFAHCQIFPAPSRSAKARLPRPRLSRVSGEHSIPGQACLSHYSGLAHLP